MTFYFLDDNPIQHKLVTGSQELRMFSSSDPYKQATQMDIFRCFICLLFLVLKCQIPKFDDKESNSILSKVIKTSFII